MAAKRPPRVPRPKAKVGKKPIKRPKKPMTTDGDTVWVEVLPPTWLERKNAPAGGRKKTAVKKRPSATEFLIRFRLGPGKKPK